MLLRADLSPDAIRLSLASKLKSKIQQVLEEGEELALEGDTICWTIPAILQPRGGRAKVQPVRHDAPQRDAVLIKGLRTAHGLLRRDRNGLPVVETMPESRYAARLMRLALLSPSIQRAILDGRQPPKLRLEDLVRSQIPICWKAQELLMRQLSARA
jgi:hypothetical protein